ncbi:MAG: hypothetical protein VYE74_04590 [Verrucomicrobiota bacterium]|nr:hypothetical protein [Verrucomicrobiota bacterium]
MQWIDHILNLAAWILWINGSMGLMQPWKPQSGISLVGTLKALSPSRMNPAWFFILGVALILCFKILLLHYLGKPLASTVAVDFLLFPVFFKTGSLSHMALMGVVTFIRFSFMGYLWLWFLRCLTTGKGMDPLHGMLDAVLGPLGQRKAWLQGVLLWLLGVMLWTLLGALLARLEILPGRDASSLLWQATLISSAAWMSLRWLIYGMLALYLVHSYVYLGGWEGWDWLDQGVERLLWPLKPLRLHWKRIDFTPMVAWPLYGLLFALISRWLTHQGVVAAL